MLPSQDLTGALGSAGPYITRERRKRAVMLIQVPATSVAHLVPAAPASLLRHRVGLSSPKSRARDNGLHGGDLVGPMISLDSVGV